MTVVNPPEVPVAVAAHGARGVRAPSWLSSRQLTSLASRASSSYCLPRVSSHVHSRSEMSTHTRWSTGVPCPDGPPVVEPRAACSWNSGQFADCCAGGDWAARTAAITDVMSTGWEPVVVVGAQVADVDPEVTCQEAPISRSVP